MGTDEDETNEQGTGDDPETPEAETTADGEQETPESPPNSEPDPPGDTDDPVSNYWLYVGIGVLTAVVAWLLIPLFGVGAVYAGYKLYKEEESNISGGILVAAGALPLVFWVALLVQAL